MNKSEPKVITEKMINNIAIQSIANFLSETPDWVEGWLNAPVKKMRSQRDQPSIDIPEFVISLFNILPIENFNASLKLNRDWYNECMRELEKRRKACIKNYWDAVEKYKKAKKDLDECWQNEVRTTESRHSQLYNISHQLADKKYEVFGAWINVDQAILRCGFHDLIGHINPKYYIEMYEWRMDPYEIPSPGNDPEGILDYWGDEDPEGILDYWGDEDLDVDA